MTDEPQIWVMPSKMLYNVKMDEIKIGMAFLAVYIKTQKEEYLDKMIAVFCRPVDPYFDPLDVEGNADRREAFSSILSEKRAFLLQDMPLHLKTYVLHFIVGCLEKIKKVKDYQVLFDSFGKENNGNIDIWIWRDFARAIAKVGNLGKTIKEIDQQYFHDVLHEAAKCEKEYQEEKERLEMERAQMMASR